MNTSMKMSAYYILLCRKLSVYHRNSVLFILMAVVLAGAVILLLNAQGALCRARHKPPCQIGLQEL